MEFPSMCEDSTDLFFKSMDEEYLAFDRISDPKSNHLDMHAFLLLDSIFGGKGSLIKAVIRDQVYLFPSAIQIAMLTRSEVIELLRCGVLYDDENESLYIDLKEQHDRTNNET